MRQPMKYSIFCLLLFAGFLSPIAVTGNSMHNSGLLKESIHSNSTSAHQSFNPRKKIKKKRTTILNRKTKRGHGHHCPSF